MLTPPQTLQPIPDEEAVKALAARLHVSGQGIPRVADCYLATLSAAHVVRCLADAGLVVARSAPPPRQLEL